MAIISKNARRGVYRRIHHLRSRFVRKLTQPIYLRPEFRHSYRVDDETISRITTRLTIAIALLSLLSTSIRLSNGLIAILPLAVGLVPYMMHGAIAYNVVARFPVWIYPIVQVLTISLTIGLGIWIALLDTLTSAFPVLIIPVIAWYTRHTSQF